ncbi:MAG: FliH/SctL family protein [Limnohabitans sp.]|jgi:flagellar biosynthesis/type III secretory pathway protein FliH|uniref:FliH/SctL family protein n=1 Tax=Limnohabitans sp. TaxID=1907725 RepID=UPI003BAF8C37
MALSDLNEKPAPWSPNPLLNSKAEAPRFLRTQWDEATARSFGPWRVADKAEPTEGLLTEAAETDANEATTEVPADATAAQEAAPTAEPESPWTEAALDQLRDEAYQRGLLEGQALVRSEFENERSKERELMRHLGIELRSISQDPQRFFEPLKRLSLHLAEQLVRAELQLSGQAIHNLIQQCIQQLDHAVEPVHVSVNPEDLQRLTAMGESVTKHMQLEADALLRPGSVRVRVQDSVVQDLIETRLEPLARRLLAQPEAWMQQSSLVKDRAEALPADTPVRDWQRQVVDVEDTEIKPAANPDDDTP